MCLCPIPHVQKLLQYCMRVLCPLVLWSGWLGRMWCPLAGELARACQGSDCGRTEICSLTG